PQSCARADVRQRALSSSSHCMSDTSGRRHRLLFHIRHFGVGGIENALLGWLRGLDRSHFVVHLSVALSTRDLETIYRARLPEDVVVHQLIDSDSWLTRMHQRRRDGLLGKLGRLWL